MHVTSPAKDAGAEGTSQRRNVAMTAALAPETGGHMLPWHEEGMEGATHVGAGVRVIELPSRARSLHEGRGPAATPGTHHDHEHHEPDVSTVKEIARSHVMRSLITMVLFAAAAVTTLFATPAARADESSSSKVEVSLLGGVNSFNQNDTAIPDNLVGIPVAGGVSYRLSPNFAAEGEFTWFIPVQQKVDMGSGAEQDLKPTDALAYQVGLRASYPLTSWSPYLAAGAGAMTFLSKSDRVPSLDEAQTVFALSFGGGAQFPVNARWGLRADFREFVGFPGDNTTGLSTNGSADPVWMERGTIGVDFRF
jgi:opacity protein-like surface antigen